MLALGILVNTLLIGNHIAMLLAIRKHNRQVADAVSAPQQQLSVVLKREKKVAMDMFIVLVILVICVLLFGTGRYLGFLCTEGRTWGL